MNRENDIKKAVLDRFFRYVKVDTQSEEGVKGRYPSTEKQGTLARMLVEELIALGLEDVVMDEYGIVTATLPDNLPSDTRKNVPVLGLLAHMDTSPEVSGKDVKPMNHSNYSGGDLILSGDPAQMIRAAENPDLTKKMGYDIITSDGTTLLGADDKAGIAEIMTAVDILSHRTDIRHGTLRIGFTPDEEVGGGTKYFDVEQFGADYAYTVDGGEAGEIEDETFYGSLAEFNILGINLHPGYAKGKMINAVRIASTIIEMLKRDPAPETTEGREGYFHPYSIEGSVEHASVKILLRNFEKQGVDRMAERLHTIRKSVMAVHLGATVDLKITPQYANMGVKLAEDPRLVQYAMEAVRRTGAEPSRKHILGGTDGARLSFLGLLTPNIFTGGHNFHSKQEWIPAEDMVLCVETLCHLVQIWVEES